MIECQIICACLQRKNYSMFSLNNIDETYFKDYKKEFLFIKNHYQEFGNVPDISTFLDKFPDFQFIDVSETENYLVDSLRENYVYNSSVVILKEAADKFKTLDSREAVAYLLNRIPELNKKLTFEAEDLISNFAKRYEQYEKRSADPDRSYIKTGLSELDELIGGFDTFEENAIITASTGQGKSWWALYFALNAAKQGKKIGYYSGEMSSEQVGWRLDTIYGHISNYALTRGNSAIKERYRQNLENMRAEIKGKLYTVTPQDFGGYPTVSKLGSFVERYDLDMLVIDQISLLADSYHTNSRYDSYTNLSKEIKSLQTMRKIPVLTVVQLNRGASSKDVVDPGTEHISGSNRIVEDATLAISVKQPQLETLELRIMKCRTAAAGTKLTYKWNIDKFDLEFINSEPKVNKNKDDNVNISSSTDEDSTDYGGETYF